MLVLVDTNVLLRTAKANDPHHQIAVAAIARLQDDEHEPALVPQCCYEYYVVATRPYKNNGLGMTPREARRALREFLKIFRLLRDERAVFDLWMELIAQYDVRGKPAHDARFSRGDAAA